MRLAEPISIRHVAKHGASGVHREVAAEQTWKRLEPLVQRIGITRLADITGLDRLGIPTYSAVRPTLHRDAVTVTCGKGLSTIEAKVGAVMESLEYKLADPDDARGVIAKLPELQGAVVHPRELHLPPWVERVESLDLEWVQAWDLVAEEPVWLPAACVYILQPRGDYLFEADSNGIAAGNSVEEAICHALAELIERDAYSIARSHATAGSAAEHYALVDLRSLPRSSRALVDRFEGNGIEVVVQDMTSELGVACFLATCVDRHTDKLLVHGGSGAHLVAEVALNRALTEAAQSRAADIQGSREDLSYFRRADRDPRNRESWSAPELPCVAFDAIPSLHTGDIGLDIDSMLQRLAAHGFARIAVVDLTDAEIGVPTVKVVVPGLEVSVVDPWRTGPRTAPETRAYARECFKP